MNHLLQSLLKAERSAIQRLATNYRPVSAVVPGVTNAPTINTIANTTSDTYSNTQKRLYTYVTHPVAQASKSPFDVKVETTKAGEDSSKKKSKKKRRKFLPPKAAVELTPKARNFFKKLLEKPPRPDYIGIMLNCNHSTYGQPRMVFSFDFVTEDQIHEDDERVSLELLEDGTPKPPKASWEDGLPKLYVNHNGFMKALGCTLDVDIEKMEPILYDQEGNIKDPNVT